MSPPHIHEAPMGASKKFIVLIVGLVVGGGGSLSAQPASNPEHTSAPDDLRIGVVGMVHGHVHGFLSARPYEGVRVVGFAEPDTALSAQIAAEYGLGSSRLYPSVSSLIEEAAPDAVVVFTTTYDHRRVIKKAARRGVHVMVEKPLAVGLGHAREIQKVTEEQGVHVLVNYETTWYPSTRRVYRFARENNQLGALRKVVIRDGHRGPKEIGVGPAFLDWLTNPRLNGAGALMDFGCYGANLMTWLMENRRPKSVTAVTQQFKSDPDYEAVDDVATIILTYPGTQGVIQASWNWPYSRKDWSVYGDRGYIHAENATRIRVRTGDSEEQVRTLEGGPSFYQAAVPYLKQVVRGKVEPSGPSSLVNNMIVMEILEAARQSAKTGKTISLGDE